MHNIAKFISNCILRLNWTMTFEGVFNMLLESKLEICDALFLANVSTVVNIASLPYTLLTLLYTTSKHNCC